MSEKFGKILKGAMYGLFLLVFAWISGQLFFERQTNNLMTSVGGIFANKEVSNNSVADELKVIYSDEPDKLEPAIGDPATWKRLINIYEPLIKLDRDLNVRPALAMSWGLIDERTWEFHLRPNVHFHDGSALDSQDVIAGIERNKTFGGLKSIAEVKAIGDLVLQIKTKNPDPLLLQRLSRVLIFPSEIKDKKELPVIGSGPYRLISWEKGNIMSLARFDDYWGEKPKFAKVQMFSISNKSDRVNMFLNGDADLLDFVPYDAVSAVKDAGFEVLSMPSLEVESIFFNTKVEFFKDVNNRKLVSMLLDQNYLINSLGGYANAVTQFVSTGTFGFNPEISQHKYDTEEAKKNIEKNNLKGKLIQIHFPKEFSFLGEYLRKQLTDAGLVPVISYMDPDPLWKSMENGDADLYFLGFRAELGDADDFFSTIPYSKGNFNITNYKNPKIDSLTEISKTEMDQKKRLQELQQAMQIVVEEDVIGMPLFEFQTLFTFDHKIRMIPRIDGFIYFDELIIEK
ncbi:hypothetical protein HZA40_05605 [Candidatus Peregrinibacteria bacterium]|nr:hypothetical protein [Candidatus Peregrinibacteria bacterium]